MKYLNDQRTNRNNQHDWFGIWGNWRLKKTVCENCFLFKAWQDEQQRYDPDSLLFKILNL